LVPVPWLFFVSVRKGVHALMLMEESPSSGIN